MKNRDLEIMEHKTFGLESCCSIVDRTHDVIVMLHAVTLDMVHYDLCKYLRLSIPYRVESAAYMVRKDLCQTYEK